jgi:hypothetical protein
VVIMSKPKKPRQTRSLAGLETYFAGLGPRNARRSSRPSTFRYFTASSLSTTRASRTASQRIMNSPGCSPLRSVALWRRLHTRNVVTRTG